MSAPVQPKFIDDYRAQTMYPIRARELHRAQLDIAPIAGRLQRLDTLTAIAAEAKVREAIYALAAAEELLTRPAENNSPAR
ncbi:hypothetical protein ACUIAJ_03960 [Dermabacteraceae bacterium CCM 9519]